MVPHPRTLLALLGAVISPLLVACGSSPEPPAATVAPSTTTTSTTTTAPTTTVAEGAIRVVVAGDSVAYDLGPALAAALLPASAEVVSLVAPALTTPSLRNQIEDQVSTVATDLVVVMVGVWERGYTTEAGLDFGEAGWAEGYQAEVLAPFTETMAARGTHVLLLREPPMRDGAANEQLLALQGIWEQFAAAHPGAVTVRDSGVWLDGSPAYLEVVPNAVGGVDRLRRTDGIHLCAAGAIQMATGLAGLLPDVLDRPWEPSFAPGWETGEWTARFPSDECPPEGA